LVRDRGRAPPAPGRRAAASGRGGPYHRPGGGDRDQRGDRTVGGDQAGDGAVPGDDAAGPGPVPDRAHPLHPVRPGGRGGAGGGDGRRVAAGRDAVETAAGRGGPAGPVGLAPGRADGAARGRETVRALVVIPPYHEGESGVEG